MIEAILNRRSIRNYQSTPVSREGIEEVLRAGVLAPSSKNRQPWKFIVVSGAAKKEMLNAMRLGLIRERGEDAMLPNSRQHLDGAAYTLKSWSRRPSSFLW